MLKSMVEYHYSYALINWLQIHIVFSIAGGRL